MPFEELKASHRRAWGAGSYEEIAGSYPAMLDHIVRRVRPEPGQRWLDVATGTGALAEVVAASGAAVTGLDAAASLVARGRRRATERALPVQYEVGDAESLPHPDAIFDVVASNLGAVFAPNHTAVAAELARVCRPGGRLALTCWLPSPGMCGLFSLIAQFEGPSPDGIGRPFQWSQTDHVEALLGEAFALEFEEGDAPMRGESGEALWELFARAHGPTRFLAESLPPERREELHRAFVDVHETYRTDAGILRPGPYLLVIGRRR